MGSYKAEGGEWEGRIGRPRIEVGLNWIRFESNRLNLFLFRFGWLHVFGYIMAGRFYAVKVKGLGVGQMYVIGNPFYPFHFDK